MDRLLTVFDIRILRPVSPIPVLIDPMMLKFLPACESMFSVISPLGEMQILDTVAVSEPDVFLYQVTILSSFI